MSVKNVTLILSNNPSYLKWGNERIAEHFGIAPRTASKIKNSLSELKRNYLAGLKK